MYEQHNAPGGKPRTYLVLSVVSAFFCLIPAIVAIVYGVQTNRRWDEGDRYRAEEASDRARNWMIAAFVLGIVWLIINLGPRLASG